MIQSSELIDTLQGLKPIKDLIGTKPWVWGWKDGKPFPAQASRVIRTRGNVQLIRVSFWYKGGPHGIQTKHVDVTPDHCFLTEFGWVEAQKLEPSCRLTRVRLSRDRGRWLIIPGKGKERGLASRYITECLSGPLQEGEIVHHADGDVTNDNPTNLSRMDSSLHVSTHLRKTGWLSHPRPTQRLVWDHSTVTEEKVRELYKAGMSMRDLAKVFSVSANRIICFMHQHEIPVRSRGKAISLGQSKRWNAKVAWVKPLVKAHDVFHMRVPETECFSANSVIVQACL